MNRAGGLREVLPSHPPTPVSLRARACQSILTTSTTNNDDDHRVRCLSRKTRRRRELVCCRYRPTLPDDDATRCALRGSVENSESLRAWARVGRVRCSGSRGVAPGPCHGRTDTSRTNGDCLSHVLPRVQCARGVAVPSVRVADSTLRGFSSDGSVSGLKALLEPESSSVARPWPHLSPSV